MAELELKEVEKVKPPSEAAESSTGSSEESLNDEYWDFDGNKINRSYSSTSINSAISAEKVSFLDLLDPGFTVNVSKKAYNNVKHRTKKITDKAKLQKNRLLTRMSEDDLVALKAKLSQQILRLDRNLFKTVEASKTEKFFYAFALFQIFYAGIIIGKYPQYFHIYYSLLFLLLMPIRLYTYWKKNFQFFLADLCYYVNALMMVFIWVFPQSKHLYMVCFSFTFGTLSFAVITWRNSLVLHSIEKITSSFIHIIPPVTLFVITHEISPEFKEQRFPGAAKVTSWNTINGILWTSFYYLIWQSFYHYFITYRGKLQISKGRVNSFSWLRKSYARKPIGKFVNNLPEPFPVIAFTLIQYGYQLGTMLLCPLWLKYKRLASIFLGYIFIVAAYNGATYYVDIFGKKLEKEVQRLQSEIQLLQSESAPPSSNSSPVLRPVDQKKEKLI